MRVYGLDISKDAIACVEVETAFGKFEIRQTHELTLDGESSGLPVSAAGSLLSQIGAHPDRLVMTIPAEWSTYRNLQLATRDKKAIRSALEFELEDDLPFESSELHYDSSIVESGPQGSQVHVAAIKKENLLKHLELITPEGMDPDILTSDAWALRCLFTRMPKVPGSAETLMLVGLERGKTYIYIHSRNRPVLYREIPFGLHSIESKLRDSLSAGSEEARNWIRDIGVTGIDQQVSDTISEILESLVPELKQSELSSRNQTQSPVEQVYVSGEGALMPGLIQWLEEATQKRCALFRPLSSLSPSSVTYSDLSEVRFAKALALAMTPVPLDKLAPLNLRRGDFAKASASGNSPLELLKKPLPYLAVTALVFFATKTIEYNYFKGRLAETEESAKRAVKAYFGGISDSAARTYLADTEKLKKTIQAEVAKERELSKLLSGNPNSPFEFLKTLSQRIGKDVVLDLVSFEAGADFTDKFVENRPLKTNMSFVVSNPQTIGKLGDILEKGYGLKRGNSEEFVKEGKKVYRIIFSGTLGASK
jgi:type IV pilus assembly protein PilM